VQRELNIAPPEQGPSRITAEDIEVAQFVNLLIDHAKLRKVISAVGNRGVLILGSFAEPPRKAVLEALADASRERELLPTIYDFERPPEQDWTETVLTLASCAYLLSPYLSATISGLSALMVPLSRSVTT
jgi:hypothetical protein